MSVVAAEPGGRMVEMSSTITAGVLEFEVTERCRPGSMIDAVRRLGLPGRRT